MKTIIIAILILSFTVLAQAEESVPAFLKDGKITVTLKDGKTYEFEANEFKVVSREAAATPTVVSDATPKNPASLESRVENPSSRSFVLTLIPQIGVGPDGVKTTAQAGGFVNEPERKAVFGATVCGGSSSDSAKLCGSAFTNRLYTLGIGLDF